MIRAIINHFRKAEQERADIDYLLMENDYLEAQNEQAQADIHFFEMLLEDK